MMMVRAIVSLVSSLLMLGTVSPASSAGSVILDEEFSDPTLDPSWTVTSQARGSYSLTDEPGSLRYRLDGGWLGATGSWYGSRLWSPTTTLQRGFAGTHWTLDAKVHYNFNSHAPDYSTGVQSSLLYVGFDGSNFVWMGRQVDWWYDQDTYPLGATAFGAVASMGNVTNHVDSWICPVSTDRYWLEFQAGFWVSMSTGAGLSTGGVAHATQTPTVGNPCVPRDVGARSFG
jgi:hypothetical protein